MYKTLPKNEKSFDVDVIGSTTGHIYKGQFTVKCVLDIKGRHSLELEQTRLLADYANPTPGLMGIAHSLSHIRAKTVAAPDWWKNSDDGADILDENLIAAVLDKCKEMERDWRKEVSELTKKANEENNLGNDQKEK
jgi:hypothetical protein